MYLDKRLGIFILFCFIAAIGAFFALSKNSPTPALVENQTPEVKGATANVEAQQKPLKIGIQAGHWKNNELPNELKNLRLYGGGGDVNGVLEWKVNLAVANKLAETLREKGFEVDVIPATIPDGYKSDIFISLHADGNNDTSVSGYKTAGSAFDETDKSNKLSEEISKEYKKATKLDFDPNVTSDMTQYYGFNYVKFHTSIDPSAAAAIIEMGFLTNTHDRNMMTKDQDTIADAIAQGISNFISNQDQQE